MKAAARLTLMSSERNDWETPQDFFDKLDAEFHFALDVCATKENAKCKEFLTPEEDSFLYHWASLPGPAWMNPEYGRALPRWIDKAIVEADLGATIVVLTPSRTDTRWFRRAWDASSDVRFVPGRLKFGGCKDPAPFPSVVWVMRPPPVRTRVVGFM